MRIGYYEKYKERNVLKRLAAVFMALAMLAMSVPAAASPTTCFRRGPSG